MAASPRGARRARRAPVRIGPAFDDRVHAQVRARAVRRPAAAPRPRTTRSPCARSTTSTSVGSVTIAASARNVPQHLLHAEAGVLLVGDRGDDDVAGQPGAGAPRGRRRARRRRPPSCRRRRARAGGRRPSRGACGVAHALDADRVEVAAQQQRAPAAGAAGPDDDARPARRPSSTSASRPAARAHPATNAAISRLARAAGTSDGLTESIATSAFRSSSALADME